MATFKFYKDAGLTQEFNPVSDRIGPVNDPPQDFVIYFGSTDATKRVRANSNPGTDNLEVSITDTDAGNNLEAADVKLADSNLNLDSAVAGAALDLGVTQLLGGVGNAIEIHLRVSYSGGVASDETVGITFNELVEDQP